MRDKKGRFIKGQISLRKGVKLSKKTKEKLRIYFKGKHSSLKTEFKKGQPSAFKGKKFSLESRKKISMSQIGRIPWNKGKKGLQVAWNKGREGLKGEKHPNWKGGITPIRKKIMNTIEYRTWKKYILKKDNYSCQICYSKTKLEIHHIEPVAKNNLRITDITN